MNSVDAVGLEERRTFEDLPDPVVGERGEVRQVEEQVDHAGDGDAGAVVETQGLQLAAAGDGDAGAGDGAGRQAAQRTEALLGQARRVGGGEVAQTWQSRGITTLLPWLPWLVVT